MCYDSYKHGRVFVDNNVITIYENDIEIAQNVCNSITDSDIRNRAVANVLAVKLAERYLSTKDFQVDSSTGLHNIPNVLENLDISDIYVNGAYIDVRMYFSDDEISVPKIHFDLGMTPAVYMFIKLNQDLTGYQVAGFVRSEYISKENLKDEYYYIDEQDLSSFYDIESSLKTVPDTFDGSREILYSFVDGSIEESKIYELVKILITSANARTILIKAFKANSVFKFISTQNNGSQEENNKIENANINDFIEEDTQISEKELDEIDAENRNGEYDADEDLYSSLEYSTEVTPNLEDDIESESEQKEGEEQIDALFTGEQDGVPVTKKKSSSLTILLLILLVVTGCLAFIFIKQKDSDNTMPAEIVNQEVVVQENIEPQEKEAMPNETVNVSNDTALPKEEISSVAIPAIEKHLDASVLVSNLKVDWEVPAGYAANTSAKRYLVKLGKVIQLNLKSELLLLNKPPIANMISVELVYNKNSDKFEIVGIKDSSGEKTVDDVIVTTIRKALDLNISSNTESFAKLQGNPVLIIHL